MSHRLTKQPVLVKYELDLRAVKQTRETCSVLRQVLGSMIIHWIMYRTRVAPIRNRSILSTASSTRWNPTYDTVGRGIGAGYFSPE